MSADEAAELLARLKNAFEQVVRCDGGACADHAASEGLEAKRSGRSC